MKRVFFMLATVALLATTASADSLLGSKAAPADSPSDEAAPVGGLFGLFGKPEPSPVPLPESAREKAASEEPKPSEPLVEPREAVPVEPAVPEVAVPASPEVPSEPSAAVPAAPSEAGETSASSSNREKIQPEPKGLDSDLQASRRPQSDVELPTQEIQGEIERPDIFFLLPKARSRSDEQLIRARIRREITRPLIKDWLEEELLLK